MNVNVPLDPGATVLSVLVAYAVSDSQPLFHAAFGEATLHVTPSAAQTARFTWVDVPTVHVVVPALVKKTWKLLMTPAGELGT